LICLSWGRTPLCAARGLASHDVFHPLGQRRRDGPAARKREAWFRCFLKLPGGVPSHDTFAWVFAALDPWVFERCCLAWLREVAGLVGVGQIAIDGESRDKKRCPDYADRCLI
jgi:hypothetical protein